MELLTNRTILEEIHKEYIKFFDNESYQNYEIYDSSHYCLSRNSKKNLLDEKKHSHDNVKYYKIIKVPFEKNENISGFFKKLKRSAIGVNVLS